MTQASRAISQALMVLVPSSLRRWSSLPLLAVVALLVLTACYEDVQPTPTQEQIPAPDGADGEDTPPPAEPPGGDDDGAGDDGGGGGGDDGGGGGGGGGGEASPETSPVGTPGTAVAPPAGPGRTVTPPSRGATATATRTPQRPPGPPGPNTNVTQPTSTVSKPPTVPTAAAKATSTPRRPSGPTPTVTATAGTGGTTGGIVITKVDPTGASVAGACFALLDEDDQTVVTVCDGETGDLDTNPGSILINGVAVGSYTLHETFAPLGFVAGPDQPVAIVAGAPSGIEVVNEPADSTGSIIVTKVDDAGTPVGEACFAVLAQGTPVAAACDAGEGDADTQVGTIRIEVGPGSYTLVETPPAGYEAAAPVELTVESGAFATVEVVNVPEGAATTETSPAPEPGSVRIDTLDASNGSVPLGGACFTLGDPAPVVEVCDNQEGDADPADGTILIQDVAAGQYTVAESQTPSGYLAEAEKPLEVFAGETAEVAFSNSLEPTITPTSQPLGGLTVEATDENGALLSGACYSLTPRTGTEGEKLQVCDGDDGAEDGIVTFADVPPGLWRLRQFQPPAGMPEPESVDIEIFAGETLTQPIANLPAIQTGSLEITLTDDQGQPLGGSCFDLFGIASYRGCDNDEFDGNPADGVILLQALPPDTYEIAQATAPEGFQPAASQQVTIEPSADPVQVSFTNTAPIAPSGQDLALPVVYVDDVNRLWLVQPGDTEPTRLDSDELPFDGGMDPVFTDDRGKVVFRVSNAADPATNFFIYDLGTRTPFGPVPFGSIGTASQIAWVPGRNDVLAVGVLQPPGTSNVFYYNVTDNAALPPVLSITAEPASVDAIVPAPQGTLMAIQTTDADGDRDVYVVDAADPTLPAAPTNVAPNNGDNLDTFVSWNSSGDRLLVRSGPDPESLYVTDAAATASQVGTTPVFAGDPNANTSPSWSPDGSWVASFDGDPQAGGQLHVVGIDGSEPCGAMPNVVAVDWSPANGMLTLLVSAPNEPMHVVNLNPGDCAQQPITDFAEPVDKLRWSPDGQTLAVVDRSDAGASVWLVSGNEATQINLADFGLTDIFAWSPEGNALPLFASGPEVSLWILTPGATTPVAVNGSTIPEGANFVQNVWWP
ncbi:MAG: SpaA isopeptide-forming pilin-related protein [Thermomicrobiales bacterium]